MSGLPIGFALARVHARHAARPTAADWRRLDAARLPAQYLNLARHTGLHTWLHGVDDDAAQGAVELKLRAAYRRHVAEVAGWLPGVAAPAAHLIARLTDLPALASLQRGEPAQPWMAEDPALSAALEATPTAPPYDTWLARWHTAWPGPRRGRQADRLGRALRDVVTRGRAADAAVRLHWIFRGRPVDVAGVYAYLGLVLDDLRRLAGGLARRHPGAARHREAA